MEKIRSEDVEMVDEGVGTSSSTDVKFKAGAKGTRSVKRSKSTTTKRSSKLKVRLSLPVLRRCLSK